MKAGVRRNRRPAWEDVYTRRARAEGHVARSVYKLEEIDRRWQLLRPGNNVLDLGTAPGSWLKYAAQKVGARGRVSGVDLQPLKIALPEHAEAVVADVNGLCRRLRRWRKTAAWTCCSPTWRPQPPATMAPMRCARRRWRSAL